MELKLKEGRKYTRNLSIWLPESVWREVQTIKGEVQNASDHYRLAIEQTTERLKAGIKQLKGG